jgi:hypothetical protein
MHDIEHHAFGYYVRLAGQLTVGELLEWLAVIERTLAEVRPGFGLILDLRALQPLSQNARRMLSRGMQIFQRRGLYRSAVIVHKASTRHEFTRLAKESGVYQWERYFSEEDDLSWISQAEAWITAGTDPDPERDLRPAL